MKRLVLIAGALALWSVLLSTCYFATKIKNLKTNCKASYHYTDVAGNKGIAKHCFDIEDGMICKNAKHSVRAIRVEEKRICE